MNFHEEVRRVDSKPDPYVVCPNCRRVNFIPRVVRDLTIECCCCTVAFDYEPADTLPVIQPFLPGDYWSRSSYDVYLITNTVNNLVYVGMTEDCLLGRWGLHRCSSLKVRKGTLAVDRAMSELGAENFNMILLERAYYHPDVRRERDYIRRFDSFDPLKGYNRTNYRSDEQIKADEERYRQNLMQRTGCKTFEDAQIENRRLKAMQKFA